MKHKSLFLWIGGISLGAGLYKIINGYETSNYKDISYGLLLSLSGLTLLIADANRIINYIAVKDRLDILKKDLKGLENILDTSLGSISGNHNNSSKTDKEYP